MKALKNLSLPFLSLLVILAILYNYRWIYFRIFDPVYFKHFYDHSQWSIANSPRIMGDGELYQYAGYSLLAGKDPFEINPEVPPVGKYFYALSIALFNNAFALNGFLFVITSCLFFWWIKNLNLSRHQSWLATLLFISSPLVFSQIGDTALDLLYLACLLAYFLCIEKVNSINQKNPLIWSVAGGLFLGLFLGIKFGIYSLCLFIATYVYFNKKINKYLSLIIVIASTVYLFSYVTFFLQGNSLNQWLDTQKWMIKFYLSSEVPRTPASFLGATLFGMLKWENVWSRINEWSVMWTIGIVGMFVSFRQKTTKLPPHIQAYAKTLVLIFLLVPFATRYLLLLLPVIIYFFVQVWAKLPAKIGLCITALVFMQSVYFIANIPNHTVERVNQLLKDHRFDDLYTTVSLDKEYQRMGFSEPIHAFFETIQSDQSHFSIRMSKDNPFSSKRKIIFESTYETPIGRVYFEKIGEIKKQNGQWLLVWDWEYIAPHFDPQSKVELQKGNEVGGVLRTKDEKVLSYGAYLPHISLLPQEVRNEEELLKDIKSLTGVDQLKSRTMIHVDHPSHLHKRIGFVLPSYDKNLLDKISTQSGVMITTQNSPNTRIYAQGIIDKKYLGQIKEIEKNHPNLTNYIQGYVSIDGFIIYAAPDKKPTDITLNQSVDELLGIDAHILF